jgi:hypothetical protein
MELRFLNEIINPACLSIHRESSNLLLFQNIYVHANKYFGGFFKRPNQGDCKIEYHTTYCIVIGIDTQTPS